MPSEKLKKFFSDAEPMFLQYHGNTLSLEKDPIGKVAEMVKRRRPDIPSEIENSYGLTRPNIRLKHLNNKLQVAEKNARRSRQTHKY